MNVSAVVPVYNSASTLNRAIISLLIQPEINEIFIVDDGSSDGSYELAKTLERAHEFIRVLTHQHRINRGASAARNLGLKHCTNEWIQFLDADDELLNGKVSSQIGSIQSGSAFIVSNSILINTFRSLYVSSSEDIWLDLLMSKLGNTCANLWNKSAIEKVGGWKEDLINTQEYELMFRILKDNSRVVYNANFLTRIYELPNSISRSYSNSLIKFNNQVKLRREIYSYLEANDFLTFKKRIFFNGYLGTLKKNFKVSDFDEYNKIYYLIYKVQKSINDRIK